MKSCDHCDAEEFSNLDEIKDDIQFSLKDFDGDGKEVEVSNYAGVESVGHNPSSDEIVNLKENKKDKVLFNQKNLTITRIKGKRKFFIMVIKMVEENNIRKPLLFMMTYDNYKKNEKLIQNPEKFKENKKSFKLDSIEKFEYSSSCFDRPFTHIESETMGDYRLVTIININSNGIMDFIFCPYDVYKKHQKIEISPKKLVISAILLYSEFVEKK